MEYVPHVQARRLASGKTRSIALHYPLTNPQLFSETARDELRVRHRDGRGLGGLLLHPRSRASCRPSELRRICKGSIADGLILMQVGLEDWRVETLRELDYPFALIGRCRTTPG